MRAKSSKNNESSWNVIFSEIDSYMEAFQSQILVWTQRPVGLYTDSPSCHGDFFSLVKVEMRLRLVVKIRTVGVVAWQAKCSGGERRLDILDLDQSDIVVVRCDCPISGVQIDVLHPAIEFSLVDQPRRQLAQANRQLRKVTVEIAVIALQISDAMGCGQNEGLAFAAWVVVEDWRYNHAGRILCADQRTSAEQTRKLAFARVVEKSGRPGKLWTKHSRSFEDVRLEILAWVLPTSVRDATLTVICKQQQQ